MLREKYHGQTMRHVELVAGVLNAFGLDPAQRTPGRRVVRHIGISLVKAIEMAITEGPPEAEEPVAAECVTLAETKDYFNWELIGEAAKRAKGDGPKALKAAFAEVEEQEDEHLYHTTAWARELWIQSLGLRAVLLPPEEQKGREDRDRRGAREASPLGYDLST